MGTCPGGTSSNVISYLCKGDVALSVGCTSCTTLLAPIVTPWLTFLLAGQTVDVSVWNMFVSILQVVVVPIALGIVFSVWHNVSGAIYANILARTLNKNELSYIERVARGEE